jgi:N-acetylmuramoyl-L-alanine amidase
MSPFTPDSSVVERVEPSPNFDERTGLARPDMIVLHYTGMPFADDALQRLCDPKARVSSHYLVLENGSIIQMVPESKRAWHAGVSSWNADPDVNSRSIGIEIANPGHEFGYPDYPARQIAAVITLCRAALTRNIIRPENIVAHSDVAPSRKQDPGEKFPWHRLAQSGVGLWVEPAPPGDAPVLKPGDSSDRVLALQKALVAYGYGLEANGYYDGATKDVVAAFQRHFRPKRVDGLVDTSTEDVLRKLLAARDQAAAAKAESPSKAEPKPGPKAEAKPGAKPAPPRGASAPARQS